MAKRKPAGRAAKRTKRTRSGPDWAPAFLAELSLRGNIRDACGACGVGRTAVYQRRDSDEAFARQMADALQESNDRLKREAWRRAVEGVRRLKFHQGEPIMVPVLNPDGTQATNEKGEPLFTPYVEHEYSDALLTQLLKAHCPEFRETQKHEHEHTGKDGGPIEFIEIPAHAPRSVSDP